MDNSTSKIINRIQIEINELKSMLSNSQQTNQAHMREHENYGAPAQYSNVFPHEPMYRFALNMLQKLLADIKEIK